MLFVRRASALLPSRTVSCRLFQTDSRSDSEIRSQLVTKALSESVPLYGFTHAALRDACAKLDMPPVMHGILQRGPVDLLHAFLDQSRSKMNNFAEKEELAKSPVPVRIRSLVKYRLECNAPVIKHIPDALALMAMPENAPEGLKHLAELVDDMWFLAGDTSTDLNWYSKRALLAGVYTSSELYMCQDSGADDFAATWAFVDRRLSDVATIGSSRRHVEELVQGLARPETVQGVFTTLRNMAGLNSWRR